VVNRAHWIVQDDTKLLDYGRKVAKWNGVVADLIPSGDKLFNLASKATLSKFTWSKPLVVCIVVQHACIKIKALQG